MQTDQCNSDDLESIDWPSLTRKLTLYLHKAYFAKMVWKNDYQSSPPGGHEAQDFASSAIEEYLRKSDTVLIYNQRELFQYLIMLARRKISNHARSLENRVTCSGHSKVTSESGVSDVRLVKDPSDSPEETVILSQRRRLMLKLFDDDSLARSIIWEMIYRASDKPEELAHSLKVSVSDVNNAKRRIWRRLKSEKAKMINGLNCNEGRPENG